ncbi:MAG: hypothetical protein QOK05_1828 [Chloroflexota bacterium]|jgi:hypothetical protein|nr:hypothetical protein [Chloroflexota bacterium]
MLLLVLRVIAFFGGVYIVTSTLLSALQTFVLPRAANVRISRFAFGATRLVLDTMAGRNAQYEKRDRLLAFLAPVGLVALPGIWLLAVFVGFALIYWGLGIDPAGQAVLLSGSSLFTLGFEKPDAHGFYLVLLLTFGEATIGLGLLALFISYLPTIYAGFSRRETAVSMLEAMAGSPPSPVVMLKRHYRIHGLDRLEATWRRYQEWFADIEESHTSLAPLVFLRSPQSQQSWVTTAGCIMDAAALLSSSLDVPRSPDAELCIRAGFIALRRIADFFGVSYDVDPQPADPTSVSREEFDIAYDDLAAAGVPMKPDRDGAWRAFNGWRVNYDTVLLHLAGLTAAPPASWSGDRAIPYSHPPLRSFLVRRRVGPPAALER